MAWLGTWNSRIDLVISDTNIDGNLTDFPVMIYLSSSSGLSGDDVTKIFDEISYANRKKIAVTLSDGTTQCYVEIERWDSVNEKAWLHVKVSSILASGGATLYLYFDSSQADNTTYIGDTTEAAAQSVWDGNFEFVGHMAQDPNGDGADSIKDSTSNAIHATPTGSMTSADLVDGLVGKSIDFDGINDFLNTPSANDELNLTSTMTVEAVLGPKNTYDSSLTTTLGIVGRQHYPTPNQDSWALLINQDGKLHFGSYGGNIQGTKTSWAGGSIFVVAGTYDWNAGSPEGDLFVDGVKEVLTSDAYDAMAGATNSMSIAYLSASSALWEGRLDEIRVSSIVRPDEWIKATNHSLRDNLIEFGTFVSGTVSISASPITITFSQLGLTDRRFYATPINITLSKLGTYVAGQILSTSGLLSLSITNIGSFRKIIRTDWVGQCRNQGPWDLTIQPNKFGYINNKRWSDDEDVQEWLSEMGIPDSTDKKHVPCGHWHRKEPYVWYKYYRASFDAIVDTFEFDTVAGYETHVIQTVHDDVVAICYKSGNSPSRLISLCTVSVDSLGNIGAVLDKKTLHATDMAYGSINNIMHVYGEVYATFFCNPSNSKLNIQTYSIASDGTISAALDTHTVADSYAYTGQVCNPFPNVFAVAANNAAIKGTVFTIGITDGGIISEIDTLVFEQTTNATFYAKIAAYGRASNYVLGVTYGPGGLGGKQVLMTCPVSIDGILGGVISRFNCVSSGATLPSEASIDFHTEGNVLIFGYNQSSILYIKTFAVDINGVITQAPLDFKQMYTPCGGPSTFNIIANSYIMAYVIGGVQTVYVSKFEIEPDGIIRDFEDYVVLQVTGINVAAPHIISLSGEDLYGISFTGQDADGYLSTVRYPTELIRAKTTTDPLNDEPVVWPMT